MPARAPKDETFERMMREDASSRDEARPAPQDTRDAGRNERPSRPSRDNSDHGEDTHVRDQDAQAQDGAHPGPQPNTHAQSAPIPGMSPEDLLALQTGAQARETDTANAQAQSAGARAVEAAPQVEPEATPEAPVARTPKAKGGPAPANISAQSGTNATSRPDQNQAAPTQPASAPSRAQDAPPQAQPDSAAQKQVAAPKAENAPTTPNAAPTPSSVQATESTPRIPSSATPSQEADTPTPDAQQAPRHAQSEARPIPQERVDTAPRNEPPQPSPSEPNAEAVKAPASLAPTPDQAAQETENTSTPEASSTRAPQGVAQDSAHAAAPSSEAKTPASARTEVKAEAGPKVKAHTEAKTLPTSEIVDASVKTPSVEQSPETAQDPRSAAANAQSENSQAPQAQAQALASQDKPKAQKNENTPVEEPSSDGETERSAPRRERLLDAYEDKAKAHIEKGAKSESGVTHQTHHTLAQSTPATPNNLSVEANPEAPAELRRDTPLENLHAKAGIGAQASAPTHTQPSVLSDPQASAPLDGGDASLTGDSRIEGTTGNERAGQDRAQAHTQAGRFAPAAAHGMAAHIAKKFNEGSKTFDIRLDPPELGKVSVKLELGPNDRIKAILSAERPEALSELQRSARDLEKALQDAGLDVQNGDLSFELNTPHHQGGEQNSSENSGFGPRQTVFFHNPLDEDLNLATRPASVSLYGFALSARQSLNVQA